VAYETLASIERFRKSRSQMKRSPDETLGGLTRGENDRAPFDPTTDVIQKDGALQPILEEYLQEGKAACDARHRPA
jgi:hypothetical protein